MYSIMVLLKSYGSTNIFQKIEVELYLNVLTETGLLTENNKQYIDSFELVINLFVIYTKQITCWRRQQLAAKWLKLKEKI